MPLSHSHTPHDKHTPFTHTLTQTHLPHTRGSSTHDRWLLMVISGVPTSRCTTTQSRLSQFFVWTLVNSASTQVDGGAAHIDTHELAYPKTHTHKRVASQLLTWCSTSTRTHAHAIIEQQQLGGLLRNKGLLRQRTLQSLALIIITR